MCVKDPKVSLVIPGRNCARTIRSCLDAIVPLQQSGEVSEILFVDDGSVDDTADIVSTYPVKCITGFGGGPGAARNLGWRSATCPLVWFIDSDCVADRDALKHLRGHMAEPMVGGVSGTYGNMRPDSLLACMIHEEIIERHRRMQREVDFLGGFNVLYRRDVVAEVGGFDERRFNGPGSPGAEDAEMSFRVHLAGHCLHFEPQSFVKHYHPTNLRRYLRSQRHHGYWRVWLYFAYRDKAVGDSYSNLVDHLQPPLAMLILAALPLIAVGSLYWISICLCGLLCLAQVPMMIRLVRPLGRFRTLGFGGLSMIRSFWRGVGMVQGVVVYGLSKER